MDESLSNELCEAATALDDAGDVLDKLDERLKGVPKSHLSVALSSLAQAQRSLGLVVLALNAEDVAAQRKAVQKTP